VAGVFLAVTQVNHGDVWSGIAAVLAALCLVGVVLTNRVGREGRAFLLSALTIGLGVAALFLALWPDVMPSSTDPAYSLTVENASSTDYTLGVMTWVALILTPVVLVYQAWTYWIFRKRIGPDQIPMPIEPEPEPQPELAA
jgi:cytochrome d ubiquinol oxidase subunit II